MSLFTEAELRVLKYGDRAVGGGSPTGRTGRPRALGLGHLTDDEVMLMHLRGDSRAKIAEAAGCNAETVSSWRARHGVARAKRKGTNE